LSSVTLKKGEIYRPNTTLVEVSTDITVSMYLRKLPVIAHVNGGV